MHRQWGTAVLTNLAAAGITNWIGAGTTTLTTNAGAITFTSTGGDPGGTNSRQWGTATLTNLSAAGITNWVGAGTVVLTTNNGAITFTGSNTGDAGGTNSRQIGSATLTNLTAAGITNWIGAGTVHADHKRGSDHVHWDWSQYNQLQHSSFNSIEVINVILCSWHQHSQHARSRKHDTNKPAQFSTCDERHSGHRGHLGTGQAGDEPCERDRDADEQQRWSAGMDGDPDRRQRFNTDGYVRIRDSVHHKRGNHLRKPHRRNESDGEQRDEHWDAERHDAERNQRDVR